MWGGVEVFVLEGWVGCFGGVCRECGSGGLVYVDVGFVVVVDFWNVGVIVWWFWVYLSEICVMCSVFCVGMFC